MVYNLVVYFTWQKLLNIYYIQFSDKKSEWFATAIAKLKYTEDI